MPVLPNPKHETFAQEVAKGKSADEAYVLAGYKRHDGNAARLRGNERVQARVDEIVGRAADKAGATVERILEELCVIAFGDITEAVDWGDAVAVKTDDGSGDILVQGVVMIPAKDLPKRVSSAISEVAQTKEGIRLKFHSKTTALEMLGRHRKMFTDKMEHGGQNGGPVTFVIER